MRGALVLLTCLAFSHNATVEQQTFVASTPADAVVRSFLGIPMKDSVDFIRWRLELHDEQYRLECIYGIGQPNTNGFINGGKKIALNGALKNEGKYFHLINGTRVLTLVRLNNDLIHIVDRDNNLLNGTAGWSYTLNNARPTGSSELYFSSKQIPLKDSMVFQGRTPCGVPEVVDPGRLCYKLKWYVVLYANTEKNKPSTFKILSTPWRTEGGLIGRWKIIAGKNGNVIYQLENVKAKKFLYLLKLDEDVLIFTDAEGKMLVGDADFSYTINRVL